MNNDIFLLHINIRSIRQNLDSLANFIASLSHQSDIIAISETKIKKGQVKSNIDLIGYKFENSFEKSCFALGFKKPSVITL